MLEFSNKFLTILENAYLLGILESRSNISFLFVLISVLVLKLNAFSIADAEFIFVLESKWVYLSVVLELECPNQSCISLKEIPFLTSNVAQLCLKSWNLISLKSLFLNICLNLWLT